MSEWTIDNFWDGNDNSEDEQNEADAIIRSVSPSSVFEISSLKLAASKSLTDVFPSSFLLLLRIRI